MMPAKARPSAVERFLHDDIAQRLSGIGLQLELLRMDLENRLPEAASRALALQRGLDEILDTVRKFLSQAGALSSDGGGKGVKRPT